MGQELRGAFRQVTGSIAKYARGVVVVALVATVIGGCGPSAPKAGRYTIVINPSGADDNQAYDVDLFGVAKAGEFESWDSESVGGHFAGGQSAQVRADRKPRTLHWEVGDSGSKQMYATDANWEDWIPRGAWFLVIASNREFIGAGGRRQYEDPIVIPLDRRRWKTKLIEIEIQNSGILVVTPMEPAPQP
jgi:hypothetical protein